MGWLIGVRTWREQEKKQDILLKRKGTTVDVSEGNGRETEGFGWQEDFCVCEYVCGCVCVYVRQSGVYDRQEEYARKSKERAERKRCVALRGGTESRLLALPCRPACPSGPVDVWECVDA
jgi:hypothetical protein